MNTDRIKELQDFANEFNRKLEIYKESGNKGKNSNIFPIKGRIMTPKNPRRKINFTYNIPFLNENNNGSKKRTIQSCKRKQRKLNKNLYKELLPWIPPHFVGNYFDNFKILKDGHNLSNWEKVIIHIFIIIFNHYRIE